MSLIEITSSIRVILDLASFIQRGGDNWYRSSAALEKFKSDVAKLERNCESWQRRAEKYGLSSERTFIDSINEAITLLEKEKEKLVQLETRNGNWCFFGCLLALFGTAFPSQLGDSIQKLLDETIPSKWKAEEAGDAAAEGRVKISAARHEAFRFRRDSRYIRLPIIEQEIKDALGNKGAANQSVRAILLEGPAGIGKSCMVRNLALDYADGISHTYFYSPRASSLPESSTSRISDHCPTFDQVLYLECGEKLDTLAKQMELLKLLGWKEALEQQELTNLERAKYVKGILRHLLQESKVLIILDDVWHEEFLDDVASLCGDHVRILVTSQRSRLCDDSLVRGLVSISMDRITTEDAQQILQVHAGFTSQDDVSSSVQECIMELITKVSTNPHALASVATAIDRRRPNQLSEWENAIHEHDNLLKSGNAKILKIHGMPYSSSVEMKFARLNDQERKLMMLMTLLEGPSVLETVIQLFSTEIMIQREFESHRSCITFSNCRKQLEDLQCVKITEMEGYLSWSIHFLDKRFVQETMADDIRSMFKIVESLSKKVQGLELEPQEHCVRLLGALYFKNQWAETIMATLTLSTKELRFNAARRNSIQSIIFLMMKNVSKNWSLKDRSSADQVFLSYICHGIVHEEAIKVLLKSTIPEQIRVSVLLEIVKVSDILLSEEVVMALLCVFGELRFLEGNKDALDINLEQCQVLCSLAKAGGVYANSHLIRLSICRITKIVLGLLEILRSRDKHLDLRQQSIVTLRWLGCGKSPCAEEDRVALLVEIPMLITELVGVLEDNTCGYLQADSACTLAGFACYSKDYGGVKQKITNLAGEQFVRSLGQRSNRKLQEEAADALRSLAYGGRQICLKISNYPNAIIHFLDIIGSRNGDSNFDSVRERAAIALQRIIVGIVPSPEADLGMISEVSEFLAGLWAEGRQISPGLEKQAAASLTWIDPTRGKNLQLSYPSAFSLRGRMLVRLGHYDDALRDLKKAVQLEGGEACRTLSAAVHAKAKLGDWVGALKDIDRAVELAYDSVETSIYDRQFVLQERGVLKQMMGDLHGALKDLDESLKIISDDYEALKQRAFVKFCLGDADGAREDAERALPLKASQYDKPLYENNCLGTSTVKFLDIQL